MFLVMSVIPLTKFRDIPRYIPLSDGGKRIFVDFTKIKSKMTEYSDTFSRFILVKSTKLRYSSLGERSNQKLNYI